MPKSELLPCPFCGGKAVFENFVGRQFRAECHPDNDCGLENPKTRWYDSRAEAAAVWNTRDGKPESRGGTEP